MSQSLPQGADDKNSHKNEEKNGRDDKAIVLRLERQMDKVLTDMDKALSLLKSSDEARQRAEEERHHAEEERQKESEAYKKLQGQGVWWKYGSFVIGILLGVGGMYYASRTIDIQAEEAQAAEYHQRVAMVIKDDLIEKKDMLKQASLAARNYRSVDQEIIRRCKYNHPYSMEEQERIRWDASTGLINAITLAPYVFDESVINRARYFINFENSIKDLCKYPRLEKLDDELLKIQLEMTNAMDKYIKVDEKKLINIK